MPCPPCPEASERARVGGQNNSVTSVGRQIKHIMGLWGVWKVQLKGAPYSTSNPTTKPTPLMPLENMKTYPHATTLNNVLPKRGPKLLGEICQMTNNQDSGA